MMKSVMVRRVCVALGCVCIVSGVVFVVLFLSREGGEKQASFPLDSGEGRDERRFVMEMVSRSGLSEQLVKTKSWRRASVTHGGHEFELVLRDYEEPVKLKQLIEYTDAGKVPSDSAAGVNARSHIAMRDAKTRSDLKRMAEQLSYDPQASMRSLADTAGDLGGWDEAIKVLVDNARSRYERVEVIAELGFDEYHGMVFRMPSYPRSLGCLMFREDKRGRMRSLPEWNDRVSALLSQGRVRRLFPSLVPPDSGDNQ